MMTKWNKASTARTHRSYWLLIASLVIGGCNSTSRSPTKNSPAAAQNANRQPQSIHVNDDTEPAWIKTDSTLALAWQHFIENGRYRLARAGDMDFSEAAKQRINASFSQWQAGYTFDSELAVLVVDSSRDNGGRFGVVIFRPQFGRKTVIAYTPYWLYRERNLSRAALDRVSGYLFVHVFTDGESYKSCEVDWSKKNKQYVCKGEKI